MYRRRFLIGVACLPPVTVAGCLGDDEDADDEPTRDDLSTYDEDGLSRYEQAYDAAQQAIDDFTEQLEPIVTDAPGDISGSEAFAAEQWAQSLAETFSDLHDEFMAALYLSETPAFNLPSLEAATWAREHAGVCEEFYISAATLRGIETATERYSIASTLDEPTHPDTVLELVLEHY